MFDERGRVVVYGSHPRHDNPAFCKAGSSLISAVLTPVQNSGRQLEMYDPATKQIASENRHLLRHSPAGVRLGCERHAVDQQRGGGGVVGWLNTKMWDQTHDAAKVTRLDCFSAGHQRQRQAGCLCGRRAESSDRAQRRKFRHVHSVQRGRLIPPRIRVSTQHSTASRSVRTGWSGARCSVFRAGSCASTRDRIRRRQLWPNTTKCRGRIRKLRCRASRRGEWTSIATASSGWRWPAGIWQASTGTSAQVRSTGPQATGRQCPEGLDALSNAGAKFKNVTASGSADSHYYVWVDQFDTLGLGKNTPIITGNSSDSLMPWSTESSRSCACPIRWASSPRGWMGASTTRRRLEGKGSLDHMGYAHTVPQRDGKRDKPQSSPLSDSTRSTRLLNL